MSNISSLSDGIIHKKLISDIMPMLIEKGAQLNRQDKYGHAPLHRAACRGYEKMVEGLLKGRDFIFQELIRF